MYSFATDLEKMSNMLIQGFQNEIESTKKSKQNVMLSNYFQDLMKPSLKYWISHKATLPMFKKIKPVKQGQSEIEEEEEDVDILILGTSNSGKSQLIKCLTSDSEPITDDFYKLTKTLSADVTTIEFKKGLLKVQEVNWSFLKSWHHYYTDAKILFFVCDVSDKASYSSALIE